MYDPFKLNFKQQTYNLPYFFIIVAPPGIEDITFMTTAKAMCTPLMKFLFSGKFQRKTKIFNKLMIF